ncbi:Cofilin/tropomyosin-type actin-binding protein-domain-containing protein [Terfezia claveryi]|nr:Cofilin/tropomyosin-type actin-binding protein-domain-containing protein [Terfezia claveryi]
MVSPPWATFFYSVMLTSSNDVVSVGLGPDCVSTFEELKLRKTYSYIIYKLSDDRTTIVVDKCEQSTYGEFVDELPKAECRYAVFDFHYELDPTEGKRNKIVFVTWSPDIAPIRSKMVYASSKDTLRRALSGVGADVQGTDISEVDYEAVLEKVAKRKSTQ